eukprot:CAMPEP_0205918558 /NCGR_PEP_ID=MMETSP1325-20131115/9874_1 /ASSEMBLY_ACC=CAM_ASM_000708 /TAXON_ID=236786 /ORGANISM="Florenciella sp., Strain RCC1007" /LENGTH=63 /DNA_ID=CAMNT_0053286097 /DNA_START=126 /DNA_END=313 /DNA_ORIENTATION=+
MSNLFRIPLNMLVVTTLLYVGSLPVDIILSFCAKSLLVASVLSVVSFRYERRKTRQVAAAAAA